MSIPKTRIIGKITGVNLAPKTPGNMDVKVTIIFPYTQENLGVMGEVSDLAKAGNLLEIIAFNYQGDAFDAEPGNGKTEQDPDTVDIFEEELAEENPEHAKRAYEQAMEREAEEAAMAEESGEPVEVETLPEGADPELLGGVEEVEDVEPEEKPKKRRGRKKKKTEPETVEDVQAKVDEAVKSEEELDAKAENEEAEAKADWVEAEDPVELPAL